MVESFNADCYIHTYVFHNVRYIPSLPNIATVTTDTYTNVDGDKLFVNTPCVLVIQMWLNCLIQPVTYILICFLMLAGLSASHHSVYPDSNNESPNLTE